MEATGNLLASCSTRCFNTVLMWIGLNISPIKVWCIGVQTTKLLYVIIHCYEQL